ncbi:hypothetical protein K7X08_035801 [Anisodus acutangulus]|uniref:Zinc knuckle CX2CX4HX4C domain-containing protein n=1 Tax=Anisodus acutangulus TaxID=402998 RepID=A0A9Q1L7G0_9SOLA|nr:hypothetical protein K7X08_035801 [Anisodus acutangulus]
MDKISYARVLVEIDVSQPLLESIELLTPQGLIHQAVEYDWKPKFCTSCMKFGHLAEACWNAAVEPLETDYQELPRRRRRRRNRRARQPRQNWNPKKEQQPNNEDANQIQPPPPENIAGPKEDNGVVSGTHSQMPSQGCSTQGLGVQVTNRFGVLDGNGSQASSSQTQDKDQGITHPP